MIKIITMTISKLTLSFSEIFKQKHRILLKLSKAQPRVPSENRIGVRLEQSTHKVKKNKSNKYTNSKEYLLI